MVNIMNMMIVIIYSIYVYAISFAVLLWIAKKAVWLGENKIRPMFALMMVMLCIFIFGTIDGHIIVTLIEYNSTTEKQSESVKTYDGEEVVIYNTDKYEFYPMIDEATNSQYIIVENKETDEFVVIPRTGINE